MTSRRNALKLLILLTVIYSTAMMWHWRIGFTFFTQLSNLYVAFTVLAQLISRRPLAVLKYTATVAISVTFWVYLLVLAPMMPGGMIAAYVQDRCASLFLHIITPLLTVTDFILSEAPVRRWRPLEALWGVLPPLVWFGYILLLHARGVTWKGMAAPYMFLNYRGPAGWFGWQPGAISDSSFGIGVFYVIIAMTLIFIGIGLALIGIAQKYTKKRLHG